MLIQSFPGLKSSTEPKKVFYSKQKPPVGCLELIKVIPVNEIINQTVRNLTILSVYTRSTKEIVDS